MKLAGVLELCLIAAAARADNGLAGHYYLNGVMEVGSELLLKPDGRFQWFLSYGAMDQRAEGTWSRHGDQVELQADPLPQGRGWAYLKGSRAWDAAADDAMRRQAHRVALDEIETRCPFLRAQADPVASPAMATETVPETASDESAVRRAIATQEARLATFVRRAEATAAAAMAATPPRRDAAMREATQAMADYWREQYALKDLYWQLPGAKPAYTVLALPAACTAPAEPARDSDPADWQPRTAVFVHDEEQGAYFNGVAVTLLHADGREEVLSTHSGGYAFSSASASMPVAILLGGAQDRETGMPALRLEVPKDARPVLQVELETQALSGPAFERMQLRLDAGRLIPTWPDGRERGRYSRD